MSGVRTLHFLKDWWKFIQIYQYYTMAMIFFVVSETKQIWAGILEG